MRYFRILSLSPSLSIAVFPLRNDALHVCNLFSLFACNLIFLSGQQHHHRIGGNRWWCARCLFIMQWNLPWNCFNFEHQFHYTLRQFVFARWIKNEKDSRRSAASANATRNNESATKRRGKLYIVILCRGNAACNRRLFRSLNGLAVSFHSFGRSSIILMFMDNFLSPALRLFAFVCLCLH